MSGEERSTDIWTVPNLICGLRILGVAPLLWAAHGDHRQWFLWIMVALLGSDWLDGKLAILLDQRTTFGARLDSAADAAVYTALAISFWWLEAGVVWTHRWWLAAAVASWGLSAAVALLRFGRWPSYHTRGAKTAWLGAAVAGLLLVLDGDARLVPWLLGFVVVVNLEAVAIGCLLPRWDANVPTVLHAVRRRTESRARTPE